MKSRTWKWMISLSLFAALAMRVWTAAQDNPSPDHKPKHKKYRVIDMGTFGGAQSFVYFQTDASPSQNSRGDLVGSAEGVVPVNQYSNGNTCFPTQTVNHAFLYHRGTVTDVGALSPSSANCSAAKSTNSLGIVAGNSENGVVDPFLGFNEFRAGDQVSHPFLWDGKKLLDLGTFGGSNGNAHAINDAGEVVGVADFPGDELHDAFLWRKGVIIDLGNLGQTSQAWDINSKGQVVGNSRIDPWRENIRPFLWENGGPLVDLNTLIPPGSDLTLVYALSINDRGEIAGVGVLAGCEPDQVEVCGHAYLLIPNGDCDGDCQNRVDQSQAEAELRRATAPTQVKHLESPVRSPEALRNMMRQRLGLPGTRPTLRD